MDNDRALSELLAGALIVQAREAAGLSQTELARKAGTSQNAVSAYENGRRQPSVPTLLRLLAAAGYEPRIRLAPLEDHDQAAREWLSAQPQAYQQAWEREQRAHRRSPTHKSNAQPTPTSWCVARTTSSKD